MQTYTAAEIDAMDKAERLAVFEGLGQRTYGTARFGASFCRQSGVASKTLANWRTPNGPTVPTMAILLLQEWSGAQMQEKVMLEAFLKLTRQLKDISHTMNDAARMVSSRLTDLGEVPAYSSDDDAATLDESRL